MRLLRLVLFCSVVLLLLYLGSAKAGDAQFMHDFTPTSNVEFGPDGSFGIGMEAFYETVSPPTGAWFSRRSFNLPPGMTELVIYNGSLSVRGRNPDGNRRFRTDALVRVRLGGRLILNLIAKSTNEPTNLTIAPFRVKVRPTDTTLDIEFAEAGDTPYSGLELQVAGEWIGNN